MPRIQGAIHMDTLNEDQRRTLWKNWFNSPKLRLEERNKKDLLAEVDRWAKMKMTGRETRNTLNIAQSVAFTRVKADDYMNGTI
jgi:hypothetical protein